MFEVVLTLRCINRRLILKQTHSHIFPIIQVSDTMNTLFYALFSLSTIFVVSFGQMLPAPGVIRGSGYLLANIGQGNTTSNLTIFSSVQYTDDVRGLIRSEYYFSLGFVFLVTTSDKEDKTLLVRNNDCEILENELSILDVPLDQYTQSPPGTYSHTIGNSTNIFVFNNSTLTKFIDIGTGAQPFTLSLNIYSFTPGTPQFCVFQESPECVAKGLRCNLCYNSAAISIVGNLFFILTSFGTLFLITSI